MATEHNQALHNPEVSFEPTDVSPRPVILTGLGIAAVTLICAVIVFAIVTWMLSDREEEPSQVPPIARGRRVLPPEPRLQPSPRSDFEAYRAQQLSILQSPGWVDRDKGIAHIPIEDAMRIIAGRGIPPQQIPDDLKLTAPQSGTRLTGFEGRTPQEPK
jgi:hypothetical protein